MLTALHVLQLVETKSLLACAAIDKRIVECLLMARVFPDKAILNDRRVDALNIVTLINEPVPPAFLDVVSEFHAERPVIPGRTQPAVDLGCRIYKAAAFA